MPGFRSLILRCSSHKQLLYLRGLGYFFPRSFICGYTLLTKNGLPLPPPPRGKTKPSVLIDTQPGSPNRLGHLESSCTTIVGAAPERAGLLYFPTAEGNSWTTAVSFSTRGPFSTRQGAQQPRGAGPAPGLCFPQGFLFQCRSQYFSKGGT